jgi:hypothetical protein
MIFMPIIDFTSSWMKEIMCLENGRTLSMKLLMALTFLASSSAWATDVTVQGTARINYRSMCAMTDTRVLGAIEAAKRVATDQSYVACGAQSSRMSDFSTVTFQCKPLGQGNFVTVQASFRCSAPGKQFDAQAEGGDLGMAEQNVWGKVSQTCGEDSIGTRAIRVSEWKSEDLSHGTAGLYSASATFECNP